MESKLTLEIIEQARARIENPQRGPVHCNPLAFLEARLNPECTYDGSRTMSIFGMTLHEMPRQKAPALLISNPDLSCRYLSGEITEEELLAHRPRSVALIEIDR